ncbi:hypothetical protein N9Q82_04285 [Gammaproteobacteria bacterium]|nr:hypothetical protein [Gammaproteobacteria bacterium]
MEILIIIGLWIVVFAFMVTLHPLVITFAGLPVLPIGAILINIFGKSAESFSTVLTGAVGAFIAFFYIYSFAWNYFFSTSLPILFYLASLLGAWLGSGSNANEGAKLMMMGEVPMVIVLLVMAVMGGAAFI